MRGMSKFSYTCRLLLARTRLPSEPREGDQHDDVNEF